MNHGNKKTCRCISCQKVEDKHPNHSKGTCLFICWECEKKEVDIRCSKCQKVETEARFDDIEHKTLYLAGKIFYVCSECDEKK